MDNLPLIDKRNYKKVLRELDISKYPSLSEYLLDWHIKLNDKLKSKLITSGDEILIYNRLYKYFEDYRKELNKQHVDKIDWEKVKNRPPKEFQKEGIKYLLLHNKCILADEQGVGKSLQVILASLFLPDDYKILIITTNTLKFNFEIEIKYYDDRIEVVKDTKKWKPNKFTIVHYAQLKNLQERIIEEKFDIIIADECHFLKNPQSSRSQYALNIFNKLKYEIKYVWLLTGTPITNRPIEYFNLLRIIKHPLSKNYFEFVKKYCNGYLDFFGHWQTSGASNMQDLHDKMKGYILRRLKKDVLKELPSKQRIPIFVEIKNRNKYDNCVKDYEKQKMKELHDDIENIFESLPFEYKVPEIAQMMIQRIFCAKEKIRDGSLIELIQNDLDAGNKIVVFTNFVSVIDEIYNKFTHEICRVIDGRTKIEDRAKLCIEFNTNDELKVLAVNIAVGAEGLNLQSANIGIINDMHLVPGKMAQVEDRLHRMGQTQEVTIKYPIYKDTVEEDIYKMITNKMKVVSEVTDGIRQEYFDKNEEDRSLSELNEKDSILKDIFGQINRIKA